jgi:hypothetical protein
MVKRLMNVGWSAAINMLPMLTNLVAAWLVLHFAGDGIWGEFVAIQLLIGLGLHVMAWGNRDYLMRVFALDSGNPIEVWRQVLFSRGVMLFMAMPILLLTYPSQTAILLLLWLFCGFLRQSFEVVLTFRREFAFGALSELASSLFFLVWIWFHADQLGVESLVMGSFLMQALRILPFLAWYGREFLIGAVPQVRFGYFQLALPFFFAWICRFAHHTTGFVLSIGEFWARKSSYQGGDWTLSSLDRFIDLPPKFCSVHFVATDEICI